ADHFLQSVIRLAADVDEFIVCVEKCKQREADCMGARDDLAAHKRVPAPEHLSVNFLEFIPSCIIIAVAGRPCEVTFRYVCFVESFHQSVGTESGCSLIFLPSPPTVVHRLVNHCSYLNLRILHASIPLFFPKFFCPMTLPDHILRCDTPHPPREGLP